MKIAFVTLGCKVNQYESNEMLCDMERHGFLPAQENEEADVYVINSCTVTAESSRKSRQALRRVRHEHPHAVTVLTGCYPQAFPDETGVFEEADIILGNHTNDKLFDSIETFLTNRQRITDIQKHLRDDAYKGGAVSRFEGHTRAFVKIQDGCNRYCTYCIIPYSRGFSRSKPLNDIQTELNILAENGYKEVVFVGINLSAYGLDTGNNIADALMLAENTPGIERIRLGSLEPDHITDEVIAALQKMTKFCPQFHLSLQSGSEAILKRMNRHYTAKEYAELCLKLREAFPDISLTTDIIVGFPGETEENFNETLRFVEDIGFMKVHVFPFSPREGTPAYRYPDKIPHALQAQRCKILQKKCDSLRRGFMEKRIGTQQEVLFETPKNGYQQGYTKNYTPVMVQTQTNLCTKIKKVKITAVYQDGCLGEILPSDTKNHHFWG